jgi:hypothetical protein
VIDLEVDDPNIIEKFIDFLYTQQYDDGGSQDANNPEPEASDALHTNTALYILCNRFDAAALKVFGNGEIGFHVLKARHSTRASPMCTCCRRYYGRKLNNQKYYTCSSCRFTYY